MEELGSVAGPRVLDLGCADGREGGALPDAARRRDVGLESSAEMVQVDPAGALDLRPPRSQSGGEVSEAHSPVGPENEDCRETPEP
jgi:hypothetical protein